MYGNSDVKFSKSQIQEIMSEALEHWDWTNHPEQLKTLKGMLDSREPTSFISNQDDGGVDLSPYRGRIDIYDYISEKLD